MGYPSFDEALVYKSRILETQIRVLLELDYPVFSGTFHEDFNGAGLPDSTKWFIVNPSWGLCTQVAGALQLGTSSDGIAPSWIQSRHNQAFPLRRDTDWTFIVRAAANPITGFGSFIRLCGRSFRDAEAVVAIKANTADGLEVHAPDGYSVDNVVWANGADSTVNRYRVRYDASAQNYIIDIDANDDGTFEVGPFTVAVNGRYVDALVLGNSTAIQGSLGAWTQWNIDFVDVQGVAETVEDPEWAAPFEYDGTRFCYLPTHIGGQTNVDKRNQIDGAEIALDNFGLREDMTEMRQLYTATRFLNRRAVIEGRAGDGNGRWAPWEVMFDGLCAEKQVSLEAGGRCSLIVPLRDRWRATADDMMINGAYSDAGAAIPGVGMNMTVAEIMEDIYQVRCGLPAASHNIVATPNNTPRNYNVFRESGQQAVATLAEHAALAIYQRISDARIEIQEWPWGSDAPGYEMSTAEEIRFVRWAQSAFQVSSARQFAFENTNLGAGFHHTWPPAREPFYGRLEYADAVACQDATDHDARPVTALAWWASNRDLGSIEVIAPGQFWADHNLEVRLKLDKFLGLGSEQNWMIDGINHQWAGREPCMTTIRLVNLHPDRWLRENLVS